MRHAGECVPGNVAIDNRLIYDIGAHRGEDSDYYLRLGYRVVAVEGNPQLAERLRQRFAAEIESGALTLIANAIGERDADAVFYVNDRNSAWGTTDPAWARRNQLMGADSRAISVKCVRFIDILARHGVPEYLKIDIEGADMRCIEDLSLSDARPRYLSIESTKTSWRDLVREFDALDRLGYTRFKVVKQARFPNRRLTRADGTVYDYAFEAGASGPFGEDLPGRWLTRRQAIARYIRIFIAYKTLGDNTLLSRLLPRIPVLRRLMALVSWYDTHARRE